MGGLLAFRVGNYENTAEREQFRFLCEHLKTHYGDSGEFCVFVGNYNIGCELDALFIKKDAIISIEFKNYGGNVVANENGEWTADGVIIKGGSHKTVLQQARINHTTVKHELKALGVDSKQIKDVPHLVVFNKPINLDNRLSATNKSWLHITDNNHFIEKIEDITCPKTDLDPLGIVNLAELLNLNSFYLTEFSNANYDKPSILIKEIDSFENIKKKYEVATKCNCSEHVRSQEQICNEFNSNNDLLQTPNTHWSGIGMPKLQTNDELIPLRNFAKQIVYAVWGRTPTKISVICHNDFKNIFKDYAYCVKQSNIIVVEGDFTEEERLHLQKFLNKDVVSIHDFACFWQTGNYVSDYCHEQSEFSKTAHGFCDYSLQASVLPQWLDETLFNQIGAKYSPDHNRFKYNLNLKKEELLVYLGTYFPRSFTEVYLLFKDLLYKSNYNVLVKSKKIVSILDLGCGTGGDIIGLLWFIDQYLPFVESVKVLAIDGNHDALRIFEKVLYSYKRKSRLNIIETIGPAFIENENDLEIITQIVSDKYDFVLSCKVICEMLAKGRIKINAYKSTAELLANKLSSTGILLIEDVTIKAQPINEFIPLVLNRELNQFIREHTQFSTLAPIACKESGNKCMKGCFFSKEIRLSHSQKKNDLSKIVYRFICYRDFIKSFVYSNTSNLKINCNTNN